MTVRRAGFLGDSRGLAVSALLLAGVVSAALFVVSYQGLAAAGDAIGLGSARWIVPVALDGGILVAGLLAAVRRGQRRKANLEVAILWLATVASSSANVAAHMSRGDGWLAVGVAASAPWFFLALTESIIRTVVVVQDEVVERKVKRVPKSAAVTDAPVLPKPAPSARAKPAPRSRPVAAPDAPPSAEEAVLLERLTALANDPASRERGTQESAAFTETATALADLGWGATALARHVGDPDRHRMVDRIRRGRAAARANAA